MTTVNLHIANRFGSPYIHSSRNPAKNLEVSIRQNTGPAGTARPEAATIGSFAASGHDSPHTHMIASDPSGNADGVFTVRAYCNLPQLTAACRVAAESPPARKA